MSFWSELRRRNVVKVGVAYAIVAWLLIQGADIVSPHLRLPEWTVPLVIILLSIGFPVALILAWAFELTPDGIKLTKEVPRAESITRLTGQKLNYILAGLLVLSIAFLLFDNYYLDRRAIETEKAPVVSDVEEELKTIAVLPFENLSSDPEQVYFVDGVSEEILNSLAQIPDLLVTARTSSFSFKDTNKTVQEIASVLGVENILEGSVRKAGNALRITAQLVRANDGFHLWSKTYDKEFKVEEMFSVQEDIATRVANELKLTLGIDTSFKILGGTENPQAYELYLISKGQWNEAYTNDDLKHALESLDAAIALDPRFALAWSMKASFHLSFATGSNALPDRVSSELDAMLSSVQKAIELEPNLAEAYAMLGQYRTQRFEWIKAESAFRKALELKTGQLSIGTDAIGIYYLMIGDFERANKLLEEVRRSDPFNQENRGFYILSFGLLSDMNRAEEEDSLCKALFGERWWGGWSISLLRLNANVGVSRADIVYSDPISDVAKEYLKSPEDGISELRRLFNENDNLGVNELFAISIWAAYFGDISFSLDAMEKSFSISASQIFFIWLPVMKEVRQTPRFKALVEKIGLVDYWTKFGWPDICHKLDNGDFECD